MTLSSEFLLAMNSTQLCDSLYIQFQFAIISHIVFKHGDLIFIIGQPTQKGWRLLSLLWQLFCSLLGLLVCFLSIQITCSSHISALNYPEHRFGFGYSWSESFSLSSSDVSFLKYRPSIHSVQNVQTSLSSFSRNCISSPFSMNSSLQLLSICLQLFTSVGSFLETSRLYCPFQVTPTFSQIVHIFLHIFFTES